MDDRVIVGIDEAGRGPWAGPLVAAAVALNENFDLPGLGDSKAINLHNRILLSQQIKIQALSIGIGWVSAQFIDKYGLTKSTAVAMQQACDQLNVDFNLAVIDGNIKYLAGDNFRCEVKADSKYPAVSAASVIAKVARDEYMKVIAKNYPEYMFEKHVGYGTKLHRQALEEYGLCPIHRRSFKPVNSIYVNRNRAQSRNRSQSMAKNKGL